MQSKFLESNTKFSFNNPKGSKKFGEQEFFNWSNNHFYRTSYNDMASKVSLKINTLIWPSTLRIALSTIRSLSEGRGGFEDFDQLLKIILINILRTNEEELSVFHRQFIS